MSEQIQQLLDAELKAIIAGDARGARSRLEAAIASGTSDASVFVVLASACKVLGDNAAMERAVDQALTLEPQSFNALVMKGDLLMARNDMPAAAGFYGFVLNLAEQAGNIGSDLQKIVDHARQNLARSNAVLHQHLHSQLRKHGYDAAQSAPRFTHALELLTGQRQLYQQRPRAFYYPELPQKQFYERAEFPWLKAIEDATADIRKELQAIVTDGGAFRPYIQTDPRLAGNDAQKVRDHEGWQAFFLWKDGKRVAANAERCPRTLEALAHAPLARTRNRSPSILFSLLRPGAHIAPHSGFINTRLICHLPLAVPPQCEFRVGNETRKWEIGKALIFDDSIEHEAWNRSDETRVVLIFEIWRPELSDEEQKLITGLLEGVDTYTKAPKPWID